MQEKNQYKSYFDFSMGALVALVAFVAMIVFQAIVLLFPISKIAKTWTGILGNQIVMFAVCFGASRMNQVDFLAVTGVKNPPKAYIFPFCILIAATCVAAFGPLSGMISHLLSRLGYDYVPDYFIPMDHPGLFILALLGLTIFPAIGEETLFRGVLLSGAKRKTPLFAIFYTAMAFAFSHGNLNQLVHQFLLGLVVTYLAVVTGGILAGVVVHATNNFIAVLLEYFHYHGMISNRFYGYFGGDYFYINWEILVGIFASVLLLIALLIVVTYLMRREKEKDGKKFSYVGDSIWEEANAFLRYLTFSVKEWKELKAEKESEGEKKPATGSLLDMYGAAIPVIYVAILALVVILTIFFPGSTT